MSVCSCHSPHLRIIVIVEGPKIINTTPIIRISNIVKGPISCFFIKCMQSQKNWWSHSDIVYNGPHCHVIQQSKQWLHQSNYVYWHSKFLSDLFVKQIITCLALHHEGEERFIREVHFKEQRCVLFLAAALLIIGPCPHLLNLFCSSCIHHPTYFTYGWSCKRCCLSSSIFDIVQM